MSFSSVPLTSNSVVDPQTRLVNQFTVIVCNWRPPADAEPTSALNSIGLHSGFEVSLGQSRAMCFTSASLSLSLSPSRVEGSIQEKNSPAACMLFTLGNDAAMHAINMGVRHHRDPLDSPAARQIINNLDVCLAYDCEATLQALPVFSRQHFNIIVVSSQEVQNWLSLFLSFCGVHSHLCVDAPFVGPVRLCMSASD